MHTLLHSTAVCKILLFFSIGIPIVFTTPDNNYPAPASLDTPLVVYFKNISNFGNPGFVRMPLLATSDEMNIFITKAKDVHSVFLDQSIEMFYSGDSHILYPIKKDDTLLVVKTPSGSGEFKYLLSSTNKER